jgi:hypothetical protein
MQNVMSALPHAIDLLAFAALIVDGIAHGVALVAAVAVFGLLAGLGAFRNQLAL